MTRRRRGVGRGAFARECLVPASKACATKTQPEFQRCRREYIKECRRRLSYD